MRTVAERVTRRPHMRGHGISDPRFRTMVMGEHPRSRRNKTGCHCVDARRCTSTRAVPLQGGNHSGGIRRPVFTGPEEAVL